MVEKKFVCCKEAAEMLGIDARTMKKELVSGKGLKYKRIGGKILISIKNLLEYMGEEEIKK